LKFSDSFLIAAEARRRGLNILDHYSRKEEGYFNGFRRSETEADGYGETAERAVSLALELVAKRE